MDSKDTLRIRKRRSQSLTNLITYPVSTDKKIDPTANNAAITDQDQIPTKNSAIYRKSDPDNKRKNGPENTNPTSREHIPVLLLKQSKQSESGDTLRKNRSSRSSSRSPSRTIKESGSSSQSPIRVVSKSKKKSRSPSPMNSPMNSPVRSPNQSLSSSDPVSEPVAVTKLRRSSHKKRSASQSSSPPSGLANLPSLPSLSSSSSLPSPSSPPSPSNPPTRSIKKSLSPRKDSVSGRSRSDSSARNYVSLESGIVSDLKNKSEYIDRKSRSMGEIPTKDNSRTENMVGDLDKTVNHATNHIVNHTVNHSDRTVEQPAETLESIMKKLQQILKDNPRTENMVGDLDDFYGRLQKISQSTVSLKNNITLSFTCDPSEEYNIFLIDRISDTEYSCSGNNCNLHSVTFNLIYQKYQGKKMIVYNDLIYGSSVKELNSQAEPMGYKKFRTVEQGGVTKIVNAQNEKVEQYIMYSRFFGTTKSELTDIIFPIHLTSRDKNLTLNKVTSLWPIFFELLNRCVYKITHKNI